MRPNMNNVHWTSDDETNSITPSPSDVSKKAGGKRVMLPYRIFLGEHIIDLLTSNLEEYAKRGYDSLSDVGEIRVY